MSTEHNRSARVLAHARAHVVAYMALGCSLLSTAGASYAALELPAASVGARQIKNHVLTPVKFAPAAIGGSIRHWAQVDAQAHVVTASSRAHAQRSGNDIEVDWRDEVSTHCIALATVRGKGGGNPGGFANALVAARGAHLTAVIVTGFDSRGQPAAQPFYVAVIC